MASRRKFFGQLAGAVFAGGLAAMDAQASAPRTLLRAVELMDRRSFQKELFDRLQPLGYKNPLLGAENLKYNIENATHPINQKPTPLAVIAQLAAEQPAFRARANNGDEVEILKTAIEFEKKVVDAHTDQAIALIHDIQNPEPNGNPAPIERKSWIAYGLIFKHLSCLSYSCDLFDTHLQGGNTSAVSAAIKQNIALISADPRIQFVVMNRDRWEQEPRNEVYRTQREFNRSTLVFEQESVAHTIEETIRTQFPKLMPETEKILRIVNAESSFIPTNKNPSSPASGLFQIMPGTWEMLQNHNRFKSTFQRIGLDPAQHSWNERFDANTNMLFGLVLYEVDGDRHWLESKHNWE